MSHINRNKYTLALIGNGFDKAHGYNLIDNYTACPPGWRYVPEFIHYWTVTVQQG